MCNITYNITKYVVVSLQRRCLIVRVSSLRVLCVTGTERLELFHSRVGLPQITSKHAINFTIYHFTSMMTSIPTFPLTPLKMLEAAAGCSPV